MIPRLKEQYDSEIRDALREQLGLDNVMQVPRMVKIVVNMGVGDVVQDGKLINGAVEDLRVITGQHPRVNRARKSIANFKLREGLPVGASVTLRGPRMWEFFDRLVSAAIPRIRDFRGLSPKGFDGRGNYSFGVRKFPEEIEPADLQNTKTIYFRSVRKKPAIDRQGCLAGKPRHRRLPE